MKLRSRSAVWWVVVVVVGLFVLSTAETASAQNITELEVRVEVLEVEVENMEDEIDDIETDVDQQDDRITVVEGTSVEHTNDIADLTISVEDTEDAMVLLQQRMSALEAANNLLWERVTEQEETIAVLESTIEALQLADVAFELADNVTNDRVTELENATDTRIDNVENDLLVATLRLTSVEEEVLAHDTEISSITENMAVLESTLDDVEDAMTSIEAQNENLHDRLTALEEIVIAPWVACTSSPCSNGGSCIDVNVDTFICMCRDGFYGNTCQYAPTEACSSSPCENGGSCVDVNVETFTCLCRDGFFGVTCEQSYSETSFLATFDVTSFSPNDPIVFDVARLNPGGHYNITTGIYTAPLDGIYEFVFHIWGNTDALFEAYLEVNGTRIARVNGQENDYDDPEVDMNVIIRLTAGQEVSVDDDNTISSMYGAESTYMYSWFSGYLLYAL